MLSSRCQAVLGRWQVAAAGSSTVFPSGCPARGAEHFRPVHVGGRLLVPRELQARVPSGRSVTTSIVFLLKKGFSERILSVLMDPENKRGSFSR